MIWKLWNYRTIFGKGVVDPCSMPMLKDKQHITKILTLANGK